MSTILKITGLSKRYGSIQAVDKLDLEINPGEIFGLLGPNGSGKTTTLGVILGIVKQNEGSFEWFGEKPSDAVRQRLGATLEQPVFYPYLTAVNNLRINARIKNIPFDDIHRVLQIVGLYQHRDDKFRTYSLGMKQRLAIASALLGKPEVLILDEPTNGLDPQGIFEIRNLILKIGSEGATIIIASHLLDEVQKVCSHVAVMHKGKKLFTGRVDELSHDSDLLELASDNLEQLATDLLSHAGIIKVRMEGRKLLATLKPGVTPLEINKFLIEKETVLTHLSLHRKNLEQHFFEILNQQS